MKHTDIEIDRQLETVAEPVYVPDMTTTVGKLKHLRHVVERIDPKHFNMSQVMETTACGTVGCMIGWAAVDPAFRAEGLCITDQSSDYYLELRGAGMDYDAAGAGLFGITKIHALDLFSPYSRRADENMETFTIAHGLARIDRMIKKYSP